MWPQTKAGVLCSMSTRAKGFGMEEAGTDHANASAELNRRNYGIRDGTLGATEG